jgi:hypothetical protein
MFLTNVHTVKYSISVVIQIISFVQIIRGRANVGQREKGRWATWIRTGSILSLVLLGRGCMGQRTSYSKREGRQS